MKYTLLGTTSALAFISLVALMPIASMATTTDAFGKPVLVITSNEEMMASDLYKQSSPQRQAELRAQVLNALTNSAAQSYFSDSSGSGNSFLIAPKTPAVYLPDATPEQIREAVKNTAPFDVEKAKNEYYAKLKAETPTPSMANPTAQQIREWENQLMLRAEQLAQRDKATVQQQLADASMLAYNKENEARQQAQQDAQARLAAEREAAIARVTATATGMGMNAAQVKTYVDMVRSEINDQENEARGLGRAVTYPYSITKTMGALEQVRPAMAQQTQQYDRQMAELAKNGVTSTWSRGALSDGQTLNLDYGYSVKSDGYVYDASGNKAARVDLGAGLVYDLGGRQITGGTQRQFFDELLRGNGTVVGTGAGAQAAATSGSSASSGGSSSASSSSSASTSGVAASGATASSRPSGVHRSAESTTINYADNNSDLTEEVNKLKLPTNAVESSKQGELIDSTGANGSTDSGNGSAASRPANGAGAGSTTAASTSEREGVAHGSSNRQVCSRESVASISQSDINEAEKKSSEASKVYIKLQQEYKSTKRTLDDAQNRYKTLPAGEAKESLRKEIDQLVKATNEKKKAYDSASKTLEAAQAEVKNAKDFYIRKLAFEVVDEFRATGNSRNFSTWLARYSQKNNKYKVDGSHFAVGRQADLIMQDEARIKAIEFLEMSDSKTAFLNWKASKPAHIDPTSVERLMGKGFESLADEQAVRGQLCLSKVHKAYVKERSEAQRAESEATLPERTSESARRNAIAGQVETTKCSSTCARKVKESYIDDVIAWQNNAVSKCGGKLTGTGGSGVSNPDRLNDSAFNACAGLKPVFRDYEKGGPKYYLLKDPDYIRYQTALDRWKENANSKCGGATKPASMTEAAYKQCTGAKPDWLQYTGGRTPAVDPDIDGGKQGGKQVLLIDDISDVRKLPFWSSMSSADQEAYLEKVKGYLAEGGTFGSTNASYVIVFGKRN